MNTTIVVVIVIIVVAIVLIASVVSEIARRRAAPQRAGQQRAEAVGTAGDRRQDEPEAGQAREQEARQPQAGEPAAREQEAGHESVSLRTLPPETRQRYRDEWNGIQQRFSHLPGQAVQDADRLVQGMMRDIGYPMDNFEQRAADLSVDHPDVVRHYRSAHSVADAQKHGQAGPEPLREAAGEYRVLVDELLAEARG